jgi:hypothetical protein
MKAIAVFQFYFSYFLPRESDWPTGHIRFRFPNFTVGIHPRNADEDLFPQEIDKTLSSMTLGLTRISLPTGASIVRVADRYLDRMEARVHGSLRDSSDAQKPDVQEEFRDVAIRACNAFLDHCRVIARSPSVIGVQRRYRIEDGNFCVLTPHTITWFNGEDGSFLAAYEGGVNGAASSGAVGSPESGSASFALIRTSLQSGSEPRLSASLIVDAERDVRTLRLREAIIAMSTACEVASDEYLVISGKNRDAQVQKILHSRASFAERRYHLLPNLLQQRSFKDDDFENFDSLEKAYRARNTLSHEGKLIFEDQGQKISVDAKLATIFLKACETALDWIQRR